MVMSKFISINKHVGGRIGGRRNALSMPIEQLSAALGVTAQQMEEYEAGSRRVRAADLLKISKTLQTPPSFFFEGFPGDGDALIEGEEPGERGPKLLEGLHLMRLFTGVENSATRKKILNFVAAIAKKEACETPSPHAKRGAPTSIAPRHRPSRPPAGARPKLAG